MNARTRLIASAWVLATSAMIAAWYLAKEARWSHAAGDALVRKIAELNDEEVRVHGRLTSAEALRAKLQSGVAAATTAEKNPPPRSAARPSWLELLHTDPKVQARYLIGQRNWTKMTYASLFHALGLTLEQIQKFEDNFLQRMEGGMDLASTLEAKGLAYHDPAVEIIRAQQQSSYEAAQKELLGEAGYQQLKTYDEEQPARAGNMVGGATVAGLALTVDQTRQLTDLVVQASRASMAQNRDPGDDADWRNIDVDGIDWKNVDEQARSFLTPAQVTFLKSAEITGPTGVGTRFQQQLNNLISKGDKEDIAATAKAKAAGQ